MDFSPDADLSFLVERCRATDRLRVAAFERESARHRGVSWSAMSPGSVLPKSDEMLFATASAELQRRQAWFSTPAGRFFAAIAQAQQTAAVAHAASERARAAVGRSFDNELGHCAASAEELVACAHDLIQSARQARQAIRAARAP